MRALTDGLEGTTSGQRGKCRVGDVMPSEMKVGSAVSNSFFTQVALDAHVCT